VIFGRQCPDDLVAPQGLLAAQGFLLPQGVATAAPLMAPASAPEESKVLAM